MDAIKGRATQRPASPVLSPPPAPPGRRKLAPEKAPQTAAPPPDDDDDLPDDDDSIEQVPEFEGMDETAEENKPKKRFPFGLMKGRQESPAEAEQPVAQSPVMQVKPVSATMSESSAEGPPLFIKVDKYKEIVRNVQQLRSYVVGLRDALDALAEMEKELRVGIDMSHKALDRLNIVITFLDTKFLRMQGLENLEPEQHSEEIEEYVRGVHEQMEKLRQNLKKME